MDEIRKELIALGCRIIDAKDLNKEFEPENEIDVLASALIS